MVGRTTKLALFLVAVALGAVAPSGRYASAQDVVLFAAQAVELQLPPGWQVYEIPHGREVRLVLLPAEIRLSTELHDAIWMTYHVVTEDSEPAPDQWHRLAEMNERRLQLVTSHAATLGAPHPVPLFPWPAVEQEFTIASEDPTATTAAHLRGYHVSSRTPWGVFELHFSTPVSVHARRMQVYRAVMAELKLEAPRLPAEPPADSVRDAQAILGSWKAYRSRFSFRPDGRVQMMMDPVTLRALDQPASSRFLTGHFTARGDLLFVQWDDGSRLNFRWKLHGLDLLLTDHAGQMSRLRPLLE